MIAAALRAARGQVESKHEEVVAEGLATLKRLGHDIKFKRWGEAFYYGCCARCGRGGVVRTPTTTHETYEGRAFTETCR